MSKVFEPFSLGTLQLRNRVIKTATYEGMTPKGMPSPALVEHHRALASGGVGMTTVAYCSVCPDGRTFAEQMWMQPKVSQELRKLTQAVHQEGAAASIQLGHCGYFTKNELLSTRTSHAPSRLFNPYGLMKGIFFSHAMTESELNALKHRFADAAVLSVEAGFDAIELHLGHGYLLSQFLSPWSNRRKDQYGGSLSNRLRYPLEVIKQIRDAVGPDFPILCKVNLCDGFSGGSTLSEAVEVATALESAGVDALVLSGGFVSRSAFYLMRGGRPLRGMIEIEKNWLQKVGMAFFGPWLVKKYPFEEMFFLEMAKQIRAAVRMPLVLLGGLVSLDNLNTAMNEGFEMVALGRPFLHNPSFVNDLQSGNVTRSGCTQCNQCVVEMDRNGVRCVLTEERE